MLSSSSYSLILSLAFCLTFLASESVAKSSHLLHICQRPQPSLCRRSLWLFPYHFMGRRRIASLLPTVGKEA